MSCWLCYHQLVGYRVRPPTRISEDGISALFRSSGCRVTTPGPGLGSARWWTTKPASLSRLQYSARLRLQRIVSQLRARGIGILITDHNVRETLKITDRAYIIKEGEIFRQGVPESLSADAEVRRIYLGESFNLS